MIRGAALAIAIVYGFGCLAVGILGGITEGPAPEALASALFLWGAAAVAWKTRRYRALAAAWGFSLGAWVVAAEVLASYFAADLQHTAIADSDSTSPYGLAFVAVVSVCIVTGLVLSLLAPARDP